MMDYSVYVLILIGVSAALIYNRLKSEYRSAFLAVISLVVYFMWTGIYPFIVLIIESLIGWFAYKGIARHNHSRAWMISGVAATVACLAFFKYKDLFPYSEDVVISLIMPLGLSYYSFKIISFLVDAYNGRMESGGHSVALPEYLAYIAFFPQIISGPISRYNDICERFDNNLNSDDINDGIYHIIRGLFYKLVIADRLAVYTGRVFPDYHSYNSIALWMAMFFFAIELYCDFAGYSYIVVGLCRFFGIRIEENFNLPYFSANIREFWTRWHISLSTWLKDYIYIPLGGNRKGEIRKKLNVIVVFAISGLWHGNGIPYLLWGIWHGIWNILSPQSYKSLISRICSTVLTFVIVMFGWIAFKLDNLADILGFVRGLFIRRELTIDSIVAAVMPFTNDYSCLAKFITASLLLLLLFCIELCEFKGKRINKEKLAYVYSVAIVLFAVIGQNNFIYANY